MASVAVCAIQEATQKCMLQNADGGMLTLATQREDSRRLTTGIVLVRIHAKSERCSCWWARPFIGLSVGAIQSRQNMTVE